ncbi:PDI protein A prpA [Emericellopsis atlantica]|uniref:protein disulfide-isomerase n=1 Tax=Emericellopsis atlantica TaxID=2614577 RepID=A0A9P7ZMC2_9HYPO|nr:PDI protein A prpA [Emericellopsis atlantica]KAG9254769.1 PDI protein A prpA [Emericellopsis atlantica]
MHQPSIAAALMAALAALPSAQAAMYTKSSPVVQLNARNFDSLITNSNYTSIVEFYAPWCGHCQNLKPAYEKAAKNLDGLAKVAAIDCDDDANKPICGAHGIQGFPTLKTFRPGKKAGKPIVEDYRGQRTASGITDEVVNKINNHVTKLTDKDLDAFLEKSGPKALLFTEKGTTSALLRSIAIDFLDVIKVGQIRSKEIAAVERFGIEKFPSLVLIPGSEDTEPVVYGGELKKASMVDFLKQAGEPNPDPAPAKGKGNQVKAKPKAEPAPEPEESPESSTASSTAEDVAPTVIPIQSISSNDMLHENCLQKKSHTCVLAFIPEGSADGEKAVESLSKLNTKYIRGQHHLFPFFALPDSVDMSSTLRTSLELGADVELIAFNARRGWFKQFQGKDYTVEGIEAWIDAIRMGEGEKKKMPEGVLAVKASEESQAEKSSSEETKATDPEPEIETEAPEEEEIVHEEL